MPRHGIFLVISSGSLDSYSYYCTITKALFTLQKPYLAGEDGRELPEAIHFSYMGLWDCSWNFVSSGV